MLHLARPFKGIPDISQPFGPTDVEQEPVGSLYPDGSIGYSGGGQIGHMHNGVDYRLPCGTPLLAPNDGFVTLTGMSPTGFGLRLELQHAGSIYTLYGHLSSILVKLDDRVKQGQMIATSGGGNGDWRDGNSTGCHLHWSVIRGSDGRYLPPARFVFA